MIYRQLTLYAYHSLLEAPLDLEALGLSLHSLLVIPALVLTQKLWQNSS